MAKIRHGDAAGAASGSVGNTTFSRGRYGANVRMRVKPRVVVSSGIIRAQNALRSESRAWGVLSDDERAAWETWAASNPVIDSLGQRQVLAGAAAYCELNTRLRQFGMPTRSLPPVVAAPVEFTGAYFSVATAPVQLWVDGYGGVPGGPNGAAVISVAVMCGGHHRWQERLKIVYAAPNGFTFPMNVISGVAPVFGSLVAGQKVYGRLQLMDVRNGLVGYPEYFNIVVV